MRERVGEEDRKLRGEGTGERGGVRGVKQKERRGDETKRETKTKKRHNRLMMTVMDKQSTHESNFPFYYWKLERNAVSTLTSERQ